MGIIDTSATNEEKTIDNGSQVEVNETSTISNDGGEIVEKAEGEDKGQTKVLLDGPLSKVYTKALNLVYANEAANMFAAMVENAETTNTYEEEGKGENDEAHIEEKNIYMYCCDGSDMDIEGLTEGSNKLRLALDSKKYDEIILAVEHRGSVNMKMGLLERFASDIGSKVCLSRFSALETIRIALKG